MILRRQGEGSAALIFLLIAFTNYGLCHGGKRRSVLDTKLRDCLRLERSVRTSYTRDDEVLRERVHHVDAQQPAYLHCHLPRNHTNSLVAWTRAEDSALLTAGEKSFTTDPRFQVSMKSDHDWVLIIRRAEVSDSGCYLCEVNTEPASTVYAVYLHVKVPTTHPPALPKKTTRLHADMHGDIVILNCTVTLKEEDLAASVPVPEADQSEQPQNQTPSSLLADEEVKWTRNGEIIDLNNKQKYEYAVRRSRNIVVETVQIKDATSADDGKYACESRQQVASHILHVNTKAESLKTAGFSSLGASLVILILTRL